MRDFSHPFWKGFAGAALAFVLGLGAWHLYTDHVAFHAIINMINQNAAKQAKPTP
jgi:hypothetical protein